MTVGSGCIPWRLSAFRDNTIGPSCFFPIFYFIPPVLASLAQPPIYSTSPQRSVGGAGVVLHPPVIAEIPFAVTSPRSALVLFSRRRASALVRFFQAATRPLLAVWLATVRGDGGSTFGFASRDSWACDSLCRRLSFHPPSAFGQTITNFSRLASASTTSCRRALK